MASKITSVASDPWFTAARLYGRVLRLVRYRGRVRGMGFLLRRARREHVVEAGGLRLQFEPRVGPCFDAVVARRDFGERETHLFLASVLAHPALDAGVTFVDVGANIGELSLDLARNPHVRAVVAFEPNGACVSSLARSAVLNGLEGTVSIRALALNASGGRVRIFLDDRSPTASHIETGAEANVEVAASTLDSELAGMAGAVILKIDVEGAEVEVLRGGRALLERLRPLIVFEYNDRSRASFSLDDVRTATGDAYDIYRLRGDGYLDNNLDATWNCVAVPRSGPFNAACRPIVIASPQPRATLPR